MGAPCCGQGGSSTEAGEPEAAVSGSHPEQLGEQGLGRPGRLAWPPPGSTLASLPRSRERAGTAPDCGPRAAPMQPGVIFRPVPCPTRCSSFQKPRCAGSSQGLPGSAMGPGPPFISTALTAGPRPAPHTPARTAQRSLMGGRCSVLEPGFPGTAVAGTGLRPVSPRTLTRVPALLPGPWPLLPSLDPRRGQALDTLTKRST